MAVAVANTVYLITGANRGKRYSVTLSVDGKYKLLSLTYRAGIGLGLAKCLLARPSTTIIASARDVDKAADLKATLEASACGTGSVSFVITLDMAHLGSPDEIRERVSHETAHAINHIDVLISNAGATVSMGPALATTAEQMRADYEINAIAPLLVTQAFWPLMQRSLDQTTMQPPKLIYISSSVGGIEMQEPLPGGSYGPSKAALNWIAKRFHWELADSGVISFALHPG
jgi:NAD(P)-dependent dehydrogenase (short-subunit alcohol dehydrogenase family)